MVFPSLGADTSTNRPPTIPEHPISATYQQIQAKWSNLSSNALFGAAQSGDAGAEYYYGRTELTAARNDHDQAQDYEVSAKNAKIVLTEAEKSAARAKWSAVPDAELREAAQGGDRDARWFFSDVQAHTASEHAHRALEWIKKAADQSMPLAEYNLAMWHLAPRNWVGIPDDTPLALKLLEHAADHGVETAQHTLARLLLAGEMVPRDVPKGISYLQKAADSSCIHAEYELAAQYANGNGEPRSASETPLALLRKAAAANFNLALFALAERYRTGLGVHRDFIRSIRLYQAAFESDQWIEFGPRSSADSVLNFVGSNLEPNYPLGVDLVSFAQTLGTYRKATELQNGDAMYELGLSCLKGLNVPADPVAAFGWFERAAGTGHAAAVRERDALKKRLNSERLSKASKTPALKELLESD